MDEPKSVAGLRELDDKTGPFGLVDRLSEDNLLGILGRVPFPFLYQAR